MPFFARAKSWLFTSQGDSASEWQVILWWELRRIPYNLFIGVYGIICLMLFYWAITPTGVVQPGEDAVEPFAIILAPFVANACYTLGWLVELVARVLDPDLSPKFGPLLLKIGFGFSFIVISVPAVYWMSYRLLQLVHVLR
jgi:hypothetical protein